MTTRTISDLETATVEWVGKNKVLQALPTRTLKQVDPFLLIHHMVPTQVSPGASIRIPPHPHAGFEVVTYLLDGEFFHRDSKGHDVVAFAGDINWMTSGSGIVHSEGPTEHFLQQGGTLQLLQIWINLPAGKKSQQASFHHYPANGFPVVDHKNARVKVLMGSHAGATSPVETQTTMFLYHIQLKKDASLLLPVQPGHTAALYVLEGTLQSQDETATAGQLMNFAPAGDQISISAPVDANFIIFGGEPIKEKVVSYGPFVMNSLEQVQDAIAAYQTGKMGVLDY